MTKGSEGGIPPAHTKEDVIRGDMENIWRRPYVNWSDLAGKTVLVTGSYGMLASYIVYFLMYLNTEKGIPVRVIAQGRQEAKAKEKFGAFWDNPDFEFVQYSLLDSWPVEGPIHYIVHAASLASPQYYETKPVEVIEPNAIGTWQMLRLAKKCGTEGFLFFSTGDIYGKVTDAELITEETVGTLDPLDAHSCYGESKRLGETLCAAFYHEYGVRTVMVRIGHTYSPTMDIVHDPRVFASFMKCAVEGRDIVLHSDGSAQRPFCYIADAISAFLLVLLKGAGGEAYNVTNTEQFLSIRELAEVIAHIPEKPLGVTFLQRRSGESYLNNPYNQENRPVETKLKELGWSAEYDTKQGFSRVYRYLKG